MLIYRTARIKYRYVYSGRQRRACIYVSREDNPLRESVRAGAGASSTHARVSGAQMCEFQ